MSSPDPSYQSLASREPASLLQTSVLKTSVRRALRPTFSAMFAGIVLTATLATTALHSRERVEIPDETPQVPHLKVGIADSGLYRLSHADFLAAGWPELPIASNRLSLTLQGQDVPFKLVDQDGTFGPGDEIHWYGRSPRAVGTTDREREELVHSIYWFSVEEGLTNRAPPFSSSSAACQPAVLQQRHHLENNELLLRVQASRDDGASARWYWQRFHHRSRKPVSIDVETPLLAESAAPHPGQLLVALRGWSTPRRGLTRGAPEHVVQLSFNGQEIATSSWDGTDPHLIELDIDLPATELQNIQLKVQRRKDAMGEKHLIDVVVLDWVELRYGSNATIGDLDQRTADERAYLTNPLPSESQRAEKSPPACLSLGVLPASSEDPIVAAALDEHGHLLAEDTLTSAANLEVPAGTHSIVTARERDLRRPAFQLLRTPPDLLGTAIQADYLIVAHRTLLDAATEIATIHRERGLKVSVVDIEDIYDEFDHGFKRAVALRRFIEHAYQSWTEPRLKYLLLVGDASWDNQHAEGSDLRYADWTYRPGEVRGFVKNGSTSYDDTQLAGRNLVPTGNWAGSQGHSASDNWFVSIDGEDDLPEIAVGRLPFIKASEVRAYAEKVRVFLDRPNASRQNALFITSDEKSFRMRSDRVVERAEELGLEIDKVYPLEDEPTNEHHIQRLVNAFDEGPGLIHFYGHGGRYIWRTGAADPDKNHDLFTLDHIDQLAPNLDLPVVLSMTCYSAPFDHPTADSIGEKLIRVEGKGALAVIAASWRNSPRPQWSVVLLDELMIPGKGMGEALAKAKRKINNREFVNTYHLLGDPALPMVLEVNLADEEDLGSTQLVGE